MNNNAQDGIKGRKIKTIVVSVIALIVILFVGIWAISGALNSGKKKTDNTKQTETSKTEEKKTEENQQTNVADPTNAASPSDQYSSTEENKTETTTPTTETTPVANENIPTTGPAEVVFSALMLGVVAMLATLNVQLVKKNQ